MILGPWSKVTTQICHGQHFQTSPQQQLDPISSATTGPIKVKFYVDLPWDGGIKVCSKLMILATWSRWLPCSYMAEAFKSLLFWNLLVDNLADFVETWYTASGTQVLPSLFKMMTLGWPLTFLHKCQLWIFMHLYGKMLKWWITQSWRYKSWYI